MDKQPLNTGEQKDMTEFFTDLITKIEEMSPELVSASILKSFFDFGQIFLHFNC
jgi:ubiquitin carboxyl-terminal hydrolase 34